MTPDDLQLILDDVETAQRQLMSLATRIRRALGSPAGAAQHPSSSQRAPASAAAQDRYTQPDEVALAVLACPKCGSPLQWRWSRANGSWFAGCANFHTSGCRGSYDYDRVLTLACKTPQPPAPQAPLGSNPPWAAEVEDLERIEKHHGVGAAEELLGGKIPF